MGARPFAYNTGSTVSGASQVGSLAVGTGATIDYAANSGSNLWFNGPDESTGYVVAYSATTSSKVQFWRSTALTDQSFLTLVNKMRPVRDLTGFTSASNAYTWITNNGFWTSFTGVSSSDVTPDAVDWTNQSTAGIATTNVQQITGIDTNITLTISWTNTQTGGTADFTVAVNTVNSYGGSITTLTSSPTDIVVSPNNYVSFKLTMTSGSGVTQSKSVSVTNFTDSNTLLDTFTITTFTTGGK